MSMRITKAYEHSFTLSKSGLVAIFVSARCNSKKQIKSNVDEDLRVEINGLQFREILLKNRKQLFNIPPAFNGSKLKGLKKTVVFLIVLTKGRHIVSLIPKSSAFIEDIKIQEFGDKQEIALDVNEQAEDGDRRPWYTFVLVDLSLKSFSADVTVKWRFGDSDDVKLVIDNEVKKNNLSIFHKNWFWSANIFKRERQKKNFKENLAKGIHYLEFWADRMPTLHQVVLGISSRKTEEVSIQIQPYSYQGVVGNEDYNRFDKEIIETVNFWNEFFGAQRYPPPKPFDPNLLKAMIYRESRMGYEDGGFPDVMQVWEERNPAVHSIRGEEGFYANEFISETEIGHISYSYPKKYLPPKAESPKESIFWGVRWLYHKAQYLKQKTDKELIYPYVREWNLWEEAIIDYNGNPQLKYKYQKDVLKVYKEGVDPDGNVLWQKKKQSKNKIGFFSLLLIICLTLLGGIFYFRNKTLAREFPWNIKIIQLHSLDTNNESLAVLQDIASSRIGVALLDRNLKFKQWLPNGELISFGSSSKAVSEHFDWWQIEDINKDGFLDIAIQLQVSGTGLTRPFYLYRKERDSFELMLYLVDGASETELADLNDDGITEIIHSFVLDPTSLAGRSLTPWIEVWAWQNNNYKQANHLFSGFLSNYEELITKYNYVLEYPELNQGHVAYQSVIQCLKDKAELNLKGTFADGRKCF